MTATGTLLHCFARHVRQHPFSPAVIADDIRQTYAGIDRLSGIIARELLTRGLGHGESVGVLLERSCTLPAVFMAILKAGGIYVPMATSHPPERLASFARQAGIRFIIVPDNIQPPGELIETLAANGAPDPLTAVLRPESLIDDGHDDPADLFTERKPDELAAILFTSGSTSTPKGVMIRHDACLNLAIGHCNSHNITPEDRLLLASSPGFILGFRELCIPLVAGCIWVPATRTMLDEPDALLAFMERNLVSIAMFTPSYLRLFNGRVPDNLRCLITAGERPNATDARACARHVDYWNVHGATEVCGTICMHHVNPNDEGPIPSGKPFLNHSVHLLDEGGREVPQGETGELYVTGIGISPGYLDQPDLNHRHFVTTPFGRAFRTFDLARRNEQNEIETIGRVDDVVKVSGQTIYLGEIEQRLLQHPEVRRAIALKAENSLFACVESTASASAGEAELQAFLGRILPAYMIPASIMLLPELPVSSSGKADRNVILELRKRTLCKRLGALPETDEEKAVATIWEELTGVNPIRRNDNFFAVGGSSLLAIAVSQRLGRSGYVTSVRTVLANLTVEALAATLTISSSVAEQPEEPDVISMTIDQQRFRIAVETGLSPSAAHIVRLFSIRNRIFDHETWQTCWAMVLDRHPALRSGMAQGETPGWQTVDRNNQSPEWRLSFQRSETVDDALEIVTRHSRKPFDLENAPLARAGVIETNEHHAQLFWIVLHHSVADGESSRIVMEDLVSALGGTRLPPAPNGLAIASREEKRYLSGDQAEHDRSFWNELLDGIATKEAVAFDHPLGARRISQSVSKRPGPALYQILDAPAVSALQSMAREAGCSFHALMMAILIAECRRRYVIGSVIVGSGISIRPQGAEQSVGHFVNLLPVIAGASPTMPFRTLLQTIQASLTTTVAHGLWPSALLHDHFRNRYPVIRPSPGPLFDFAMTAVPSRIFHGTANGKPFSLQPLHGIEELAPAGLDISFSHELLENGSILLSAIRNPETCNESMADECLCAMAAMACWIARRSDQEDLHYPCLLPEEESELERFENGPSVPLSELRCHEQFEQHVDANPDRIAVVGLNMIVTRSALDELANGLAFRLLTLGLGRGSVVAVPGAASEYLPAIVLGIWKAGSIYLPLDRQLPPKRIADLCADASAEAVILTGEEPSPDLSGIPELPVLKITECIPDRRRPAIEGSSEDTAYIVYTSGTTGRPKGVPVSHKGMENSIHGIIGHIGIISGDRISLSSTISFDASLLELGIGLLGAIPLFPVPPELRDDPWTMKGVYREHGVTIAFHTPSYLRISENIPFEGLRILMTGGEHPNHRDVMYHAGRCEFWNMYGPTETSIIITGGRIGYDHDPARALDVGRPLQNMRVSIRRADGSRLPPGAYGELWLGGTGTSGGYLNRPDLNAACFVTTPEGRFYRSGDLGRWNAAGNLEIAGRIDQQIKINGQRIEPEEIEQILLHHHAVASASVVVETLDTGIRVLRAFIVPDGDKPVSQAELGAHLADHLPPHMCPASITSVDAIPLSPNGKADRNALLALMHRHGRNLCVTDGAPDETEKQIAALWSELLGIRKPLPEDNFFALGGNSLLAVTVSHRLSILLGKKIEARALFIAPKLSDFVRLIDERRSGDTIMKKTGSPLATLGEQEFRIAESAGLDTRTFIIPLWYRLSGDLSFDRLQEAWSHLTARHEALRMCFREDLSGRLMRHVQPLSSGSLDYFETEERNSAISHIRQQQANPLSMGSTPLWRAGLIRVASGKSNYFWMAIHHAIADGQSLITLVSELSMLLDGHMLPPLEGNASHFAARELEYLASPDAETDSDFWQQLLASAPESAFDEPPLDFPRSAEGVSGKHRMSSLLEPGTLHGLKQIAKTHNASIHALMISLLAMEAGRRSCHDTILIGTPASLRESEAENRIMTCAVNMLPLPVTFDTSRSFGELAESAQHILADSLKHARHPFSLICKRFWNERPGIRNPLRYPLFDLSVSEHPALSPGAITGRLSRELPTEAPPWYEFTAASPGQDIALIHEELEDGSLLLQLHMNAKVLSKSSAEQWIKSISAWIRWLSSDPSRAEKALPKLLDHEKNQLACFEATIKIQRPPLRFHELFEAVVDRPGQGERTAVEWNEGILSYRELDQAANGIAERLRQHGVESGAIVGLLVQRCPVLAAFILGIWKSGATYLPLDASMPVERVRHLIDDTGCSLLAVANGLSVPDGLLPTVPVLHLPDPAEQEHFLRQTARPLTPGSPDQIAYIIYTSGSTGLPKGVPVTHTSYVNLVLGTGEVLGIRPEDRCLSFSAPSFDLSLSDFGVPLSSGAALCPAPENTLLSHASILSFIEKQRISIIDITPAYLSLFRDTGLPASVRTLVTGGEAPVIADIRQFEHKVAYYNAYGPTENTITSTIGRIEGSGEKPVSAGRPLPNTCVLIRNMNGEPMVPGAIGEVWLGGSGVAEGYLNRPELTREKFIETIDHPVYRSGDLGRWLPDGSLQLLGRIDEQLKLNGIRIEPGEIEYALATHPAIAQVIVAMKNGENGQKSLWAFVRLASGHSELPGDWHRHLSDSLPAQLMPAGLIIVEEFPVTSSGKIDRRKLIDLLDDQLLPKNDGGKPFDGLEQTIVEVWEALFPDRQIRSQDNFFSLGGHSLLAIDVARRLETRLGVPVPARLLFSQPTLADFAESLRSTISAVQEIPDRATDTASVGQEEFWIAEKSGFGSRGFTMTLTLRVHDSELSPEDWQQALTAIAERHEALRTTFRENDTGTLLRVVNQNATSAFELTEIGTSMEALTHIKQRQTAPVSMTAPILWNAGIVTVFESGETFLWMSMHHAISDGISLGIIISDLSTLASGHHLAEGVLSFGSMVASEQHYLASQECRKDAAFWSSTLKGLLLRHPDALDEWPLDYPRAVRRNRETRTGSRVFRRNIDTKTTGRLKAIAMRNQATLHALILALTGHEVRRRINRDGFLIGTSVSTRQNSTEDETVGYCINMLPLLCERPADPSFDAAVHSMQQNIADTIRHSRYPFSRICIDFREHQQEAAANPLRFPLFDLAVTENPAITPDGTSLLEPINLAVFPENGDGAISSTAPLQDLVLAYEEQQDGSMMLTWYANSAIYSHDIAKAWIDSITAWMGHLASLEHYGPICLPKLLPSETEQIVRWQQGPALSSPFTCFPELFDHLAERTPEAPALVTAAATRTYRDVSRNVMRIAEMLASLETEKGETVCVYTERSSTLPETVMGIWRYGACYVPLFSELPVERLAFMMQDCSARILLVTDGIDIPPALASMATFCIRPEEYCPGGTSPLTGNLPYPGPDDRAYIIYTSGTTGIPKGAVLKHGGLLNLSLGAVMLFETTPEDRILSIASPSFDLWISDLVMAWGCGATLIPATQDNIEDIAGLQENIRSLNVSVTSMSPSYLHLFNRASLHGLRTLITVGEPPVPEDSRHYARSLAVFNGYGPTENTAASSIGKISPDSDLIDAGRPMPNTSILILDPDGYPLPPGVRGEIWLSGSNIAEGYLNHPELTSEKFVDTPEGRRYRSGDFGRWLPSGNLQLLGRLDDQVKLRGQRIELGEIERHLERIPGVRQAAALIMTAEDNSQSLHAAVALETGTTLPAQSILRNLLAISLPPWMLPSSVEQLPAIPHNAAGKIDRKALSALLAGMPSSGTTVQKEFRTPAEHRIAEIWSELLGRKPESPDDNFFELGGDSLKAIGTINRLRQEFRCSVNDLYENPLLSEFAKTCCPQPGYVRSSIESIRKNWLKSKALRSNEEFHRKARFDELHALYQQKNQEYLNLELQHRRTYRHVLLTGASGYLGSHLLRELLSEPEIRISAIIRNSNNGNPARARLEETLCHYFGRNWCQEALSDNRLQVLAGNLRNKRLGLEAKEYVQLTESVDAVFHCAANVSHLGHFDDFMADNVDATQHLLEFSSASNALPTDFHHISTLSVSGHEMSEELRLFTEYDPAPVTPDPNYYIRTKQIAERLVIASREKLVNATIHRVGNIGFASDKPVLQKGIEENAFFRHLVALLQLGAVPENMEVAVSHVDLVAKAIVRLAETSALVNQTHHIETNRRLHVADLIRSGGDTQTETCRFDQFLSRLSQAADNLRLSDTVMHLVEDFGLLNNSMLIDRFARPRINSERTNDLLLRIGLLWPEITSTGINLLMEKAFFASGKTVPHRS